MITLTDPVTANSVQFDPDLGWRWTDEFDWQPVVASGTRSLGGKPIIQFGQKIGGRPITLGGGARDKAWLQGTDVELLAAWASVPGKTLNLALRGDLYQVIFRHIEPPSLLVEPVIDFDNRDASDYFMVIIKLMELA